MMIHNMFRLAELIVVGILCYTSEHIRCRCHMTMCFVIRP